MQRYCLILILFLSIYSCNSEIKPVEFDMISVDETFDAEISASYNVAKGNSELATTINLTIEEAIVSLLSDPGVTTDLKSALNDFNEEYISFKAEFPESSEPVWELYIETERTYQSEDIITLAISVYEFQGGAHGNDKIIFLNLNAETGSILKMKDIINDLEGFKSLAENHFKKSLNSNTDEPKIEDYFFGEPYQLPENIGFSEDGLVMLYNTYEIASYDKGYTEYVIPIDEVEPFLK